MGLSYYYMKDILKWRLNKFKKYSLPTSLIYFITNKCNSNCRGCLYWNELNLKQKELTLNEIKKISHSIGKLNYLLLSGGEPFLREDLIDVCEVFIKQNNIWGMHIPTNGLLTDKIFEKTKQLLERNKKIIIHMTLSLDGFKKTNDSLRCKGSFKKTLETFDLLKTLRKDFPNLLIALNTVVSNKNYGEILDFANFIRDKLDLFDHRILPIRGELGSKDLRPVSSEEWSLLTQKLKPIKSKYLPKHLNPIESYFFLLAYKRLNNIIINALAGKKWPFKCRAGETIGVLEPEGSIRLCELTKKIGNVRNTNYDFRKAWYSDKANELRKEITTGDCSKGCTHGCFLTPSLKYNPLNFLIPR